MWFSIAIASFFLLSVAAVIDKFLLTKTRVVPLAFAFYIALGGILSSALLFFEAEFYWPAFSQLWILAVGGAALFFGLYFMFKAVEVSEVSKANPLIVSLTPLFVWLLSFGLGLELISWQKILGIIFLLIGGYYLSQVGQIHARINKQAWLFIALAALGLGLVNVLSKLSYDQMPFISSFVWIRWFTLLAAIIFVAISGKWQEIILANKKSGQEEVKIKSALGIFIFGQVAGSAGVILMQYAIKLGNVILVTALSGLQFLFILLLVYLFSRFYPKILHEDISRNFIGQKIAWSLVLVLGVILIFL
ncbi:MAG: DMT family transporter [Candidatus Komeilibacteria bacterium]|nr:DMT family transporter [Candidatus Komeilibacteria bacterium]